MKFHCNNQHSTDQSNIMLLSISVHNLPPKNNKSFQHSNATHPPVIKNIDINSTITNLCLLVPSHSNGWSASETLAFSPKAATAASNPRASSVGNRKDGLSSWHLGSRPTVAEDSYPVVRSLMTKPLGHLIHSILSFLQIKSQETPKDIKVHLQNDTI